MNRFGRWAALVVVPWLAGCGRAFGPEPMRTATISGRVLIDGKPLTRGWLEMMPADGTIGLLRSAPIGRDGSFRIDRVPVGTVAIRFAGPPIPGTGLPRIDRFLFEIRRSPLIRRTIGPEGGPMNLDILDEAREFTAKYPSF